MIKFRVLSAFVFISASILSFYAGASAAQEPSMTYNSSTRSHTLNIGTAAKKALDKYQKENRKGELQILPEEDYLNIIRETFENNNQTAPNATLGDFNGDNKKDVVAFFRSPATQEVIMLSLFSESDGSYKARKILDWSEEDFKDYGMTAEGKIMMYPDVVEKGKMNFVKPEQRKELAGRDGLRLDVHMGHSELIYFDGKQFNYSAGEVRVDSAPPEARNDIRDPRHPRYITPVGVFADEAVYRRPMPTRASIRYQEI